MNQEWSYEQIKAIKESLEHWYENLMLLELNKLSSEESLDKDISIYSEDCALCQVFRPKECFGCPLNMIGEECGDYGSAWNKVSYALNEKDNTYSNIRKSFLNMIKTLESLLK